MKPTIRDTLICCAFSAFVCGAFALLTVAFVYFHSPHAVAMQASEGGGGGSLPAGSYGSGEGGKTVVPGSVKGVKGPSIPSWKWNPTEEKKWMDKEGITKDKGKYKFKGSPDKSNPGSASLNGPGHFSPGCGGGDGGSSSC